MDEDDEFELSQEKDEEDDGQNGDEYEDFVKDILTKDD